MDGLNYYRIKTGWLGEANESGQLQKMKTEELVLATSYTEAEKVAYELVGSQNRRQFSDDVTIEILKTKIEDIIYNNNLHKDDNLVCGLVSCYFEEGDETGVGLYGVKVMFITIDEKTAKEKRSHKTLYIPATSNAEASKLVAEYLKNSVAMGDFVVREAKFDPTAAIMWPMEVYQNKVKEIA